MNRFAMFIATPVITCFSLLSPSAMADEHKATKMTADHKIIVQTTGGNAEEILKEVEARLGDTGEIDVEVIMDGNGPMMPPMTAGPHKAIFAHHMGHPAELSRDAANCIIKNIDNLRVESATHLLRSACAALHPAPDSE